MPLKKDREKKIPSSSTKKNSNTSNVVKPEKIAFSFTANANLNDGGSSTGNNHSLWISKQAMIQCGLSYGDIVIVQTMRDNNRIFCTASVQLSKSLKDNEVLCSDCLFRCLSPSMSIVPVTVFRSTPSSTTYPTDKITLSLFCQRSQFDRFNKNISTTNSNKDFIHALLMKLLGMTILQGQSVLFNYMGITVRGIIKDVSFPSQLPSMPTEANLPPPLHFGLVSSATQISVEYEDEENPVVPDQPSEPSPTVKSLDAYVGGLAKPKQELTEIIQSCLFHYDTYLQHHIQPPHGVLLFGPPGSGKTLLVRSLVNVYKLSFFTTNIASLLSCYLGESEKQLTQLFNQARQSAPAILFLDEIDALCPSRESSSTQTARLCSLLLSLFDELTEPVLVIGATNRPGALDAGLRRPGRFDREIEIEIPSNKDRIEILNVLLASVPHKLTDEEITFIADHTHGYSGADLRLLITEASLQVIQDQENNQINFPIMKEAIQHIRPSALREIAVTVPNVHWSDIGGLEEVKKKMVELIEWPMLYADKLQYFHITPPKGVLLYGPPGCSKTLLAKAIATEANMNFISVKGPELYSKYVGESEQAVATVFRRARLSSPCVIFFDEIDAFASARGSTSGVTERVVSQFLTELDGIHVLKRVLVIAATNRPDLLDEALLRPGRLDTHIFLGLPDVVAREKILNVHLSHVPLKEDINTAEIAQLTEGYSGAELAAVCTEACMMTLNDDMNASCVDQEHLKRALTTVKARTSPELLQLYIRFNDQKKFF